MDSSDNSLVGGVPGQSSPSSGALSEQHSTAQLAVGLSPKQREALTYFGEGLSVAIVAKRIGAHRGTVSRWLREDTSFIAAHNALLRELAAGSTARALALADKALDTVSGAIDDGNAQIAMQLLNRTVFSKRVVGSASPEVVGNQLKLEQQREKLDLQKQKAEFEVQYEFAMKAREQARSDRAWRTRYPTYFDESNHQWDAEQREAEARSKALIAAKEHKASPDAGSNPGTNAAAAGKPSPDAPPSGSSNTRTTA